MLTFTEFLKEEPQWQKSLFHIITSSYIQQISGKHKENSIIVPLKYSFLSKYFDSLSTTAIHIAGLDKLPELLSISGKKSKHISALTHATSMSLQSGNWGGSGAAYIVSGSMLLSSKLDAWSVPTKQGTRVIDLSSLNIDSSTYSSIESRYTKYMLSELLRIANSYNISEWPQADSIALRQGKTVTQNMQELADYFERIESGLNPSISSSQKRNMRRIQHEFIRSYMDFWAKEFSSFTELWKSILFQSAKGGDAHNEVVLSNISVESVHVLSSKVEQSSLKVAQAEHPSLTFTVHDSIESMIRSLKKAISTN